MSVRLKARLLSWKRGLGPARDAPASEIVVEQLNLHPLAWERGKLGRLGRAAIGEDKVVVLLEADLEAAVVGEIHHLAEEGD
jgi:hypothetical protein